MDFSLIKNLRIAMDGAGHYDANMELFKKFVKDNSRQDIYDALVIEDNSYEAAKASKKTSDDAKKVKTDAAKSFLSGMVDDDISTVAKLKVFANHVRELLE